MKCASHSVSSPYPVNVFLGPVGTIPNPLALHLQTNKSKPAPTQPNPDRKPNHQTNIPPPLPPPTKPQIQPKYTERKEERKHTRISQRNRRRIRIADGAPDGRDSRERQRAQRADDHGPELPRALACGPAPVPEGPGPEAGGCAVHLFFSVPFLSSGVGVWSGWVGGAAGQGVEG